MQSHWTIGLESASAADARLAWVRIDGEDARYVAHYDCDPLPLLGRIMPALSIACVALEVFDAFGKNVTVNLDGEESC